LRPHRFDHGLRCLLVATDIAVKAERSLDGWLAEIRVGARVHHVRVSEQAWQRLTGGHATVEDLLKASFEFLLEREPPESILQAFEVNVIPRYFPEYERVMRERFGARSR
jgi:hypothetical protein